MFESKTEYAKRTFKIHGIRGITNLTKRQIGQAMKTETVNYYSTAFQIETTTFCNLKCKTCERTYMDRGNRHMTFAEFRRIINCNPYLQKINLTGLGEGMLNPDFIKMIAYAKRKGIFVWFTSNMTVLTRELSESFVQLCVDEIVFSLDGGTKETYEALRQGAEFETVTKNALMLKSVKEEYCSETPEFNTNTVITRQNLKELPKIVELSHSLGAGMCSFTGCISFGSNKDVSEYSVSSDEMQSIFIKAEEKAKELSMRILLPSDNEAVSCEYLWMNPFFRCNGNIQPCCFYTDHREKSGELESFTLGNLKQESFMEIWNCEIARDMRRRLATKDFSKYPAACKNCWVLKNKGSE